MLLVKMTQVNFKRTLSPVGISDAKLFHKRAVNSVLNSSILTHSYMNNLKFCTVKQNMKLMNLFHSSSMAYSRKCCKSKITVCMKFYTTRILGNYRCFHTSERRYIHPVFWVMMKPVLKLFAVLSGRGFRKWWKDLPPNKKKHFINVMKENKLKIGIFALTSVLLSVIYYESHLEESPVTKRKRFMAFSPKQIEKLNEYEFQQVMRKLQSRILPVHHPATRRVGVVVNRILDANSDIKGIKQKKWSIAVIDDSTENAFALPIGYVFVFTGMINLCSNDDQLGFILAHEMAHSLENHGAENVSFLHLLDSISIVIIAAIWAILPSDAISLLTHWLYQKSSEVFLQLPYSRKVEAEADFIGLQLAAKACFDVRESSAFWAKMAILNKTMGDSEIEFLSTHPSHETRSEYLDDVMNKALKLRFECGCPPLKRTDPRTEVEVITKTLETARRKYLQQYPKPVYTFSV